MPSISYTDEELFILRFLEEEYKKGNNNFIGVNNILEKYFPQYDHTEVNFWVSHLEENKLIESVRSKDSISLKIREYEGRKFIKENLDKFEKFNGFFLEQYFFNKKGSNKLTRHALSTNKEDHVFLELGFSNQGLIGYIFQKPSDQTRELCEKVIEDDNSFFYYFSIYESKEDLSPLVRRTSSKKVIGHVLTQSEKEKTLNFRRYHNELTSDRFYCTNPRESLLSKDNYGEEAYNGFGDSFLLGKYEEGALPLYVYSTQPEVFLFNPLDEKEEITDPSANSQTDGDTRDDQLGREQYSRNVLSSILDNEDGNGINDSFTMLLDGPWGSGKSSILNFLRKDLVDRGWLVVNYNAWEHQHFGDPWWILINSISDEASKKVKTRKFNSHIYWKWKLQYRNQGSAIMLVIGFIVSILLITSGDAELGSTWQDLTVSTISGILGLLISIISAISAVANNFFRSTITSQELKKRFTAHPFKEIRKRFEEIAEQKEIAIIIDDLDRCEVNATVSLLESIQTLFKGKPVLYIIAADAQWIRQCFNTQYHDFKPLVNVASSVGGQFLEKSFQLIVPVPKPKKETWLKFYDKLIGQKAAKKKSGIEESSDIENKEESNQTEIKKENKNVPVINDEGSQVSDKFEDVAPKLLKKHHNSLNLTNPRRLKIFINKYVIMRLVLETEGNSEFTDDDKTIRYLIFSTKFPAVSRLLKTGEIELSSLLDNELEPLIRDDKNSILTKAQKDEIVKLIRPEEGSEITDEDIKKVFISI